MTRFRNRRDPEGKFALTTPQNPDINNLPGFSPAEVNRRLQEIRRQADAASDASLAALAQLALDATQAAAATEHESPAPVPALSSKSRESHMPHAPFAHAVSDASSAPDAASELQSAAPELASAPTAKSRESRTPHAPFAHAVAVDGGDEVTAARTDQVGASAPTSAPQPEDGAQAPTSMSRESQTPHVPFAHAVSVAASAPDASTELKSSAPELVSAPTAAPQLTDGAQAPTSMSRESRTLHAPFAHPSVGASADGRAESGVALPRDAAPPPANLTDDDDDDDQAPTPPRDRDPRAIFARHKRKCLICNHPDREEIEFEFVNWARPYNLAKEYGIRDYRAFRRHARATGLDLTRRYNVRSALEHLIEEAERVPPDADTVVRAIRAYAHINDRGEWQNPPSHVIVSSGSHLNVGNNLNLSIQNPAQQTAALDSRNGNAPIDIHSAVDSPPLQPISNNAIRD